MWPPPAASTRGCTPYYPDTVSGALRALAGNGYASAYQAEVTALLNMLIGLIADDNMAGGVQTTAYGMLALRAVGGPARISGTLLLALSIFLFVGYSLEGQPRGGGTGGPSTIVLSMFIAWGVGLVGLLLAFWKEGVGGILSLAAFVMVGVLTLFNPEASKLTGIVVALVFCIPSVLYVWAWALTRPAA